MQKRSHHRGCTLLEVLIVLVILGILAGLAIPAYNAVVERSRSTEALASLSATRDAMIRFHSENGTYVGATFGTIDHNPNLLVGGQTRIFTYTLRNITQNTFTITARRTALTAADTVTLDQSGQVVLSGVYA